MMLVEFVRALWATRCGVIADSLRDCAESTNLAWIVVGCLMIAHAIVVIVTL